MEIIQIRCKAKSFNSAFDVCLDVRGGIGDATRTKDVETALRGDYLVFVSNVLVNEIKAFATH